MVRTYKRKSGSRQYGDYTPQQLAECLRKIRNGEITQKRASQIYHISLRTIAYKLKDKHQNKKGKPKIFTDEEEAVFARCTMKLSECGFPITQLDLRYIVGGYVQQIGRNVKNFKYGYLPGLDWARSFLKRHPELSIRCVANIKKARASITEESIREYVTNLTESLQDVPPQNIYNYDETNLTNDPGLKKCVVKRGEKYPVIIRNTSKTSISLMLCGNAIGELVPPYVVYKSNRLWTTWVEGGPENARYFNTPSGWFDSMAFEDWFINLMLPILRRKEGKKVLIGDNLSSHISSVVLEKCEENNIKFICLPPNSTHLTQPLDVAFFRSLKASWRKILTEYKDSASGINKTSLDKQHFPALLRKLMDDLQENGSNNLRSGFRKCSIHPIDVEELLKGFRKPCDQTAIENSFQKYLDEKTAKLFGTEKNKQRRKKVNVSPGRSITLKDVQTGSKTHADLPHSDIEDDPRVIDNISDDDIPVSSTPAVNEKNSAVLPAIENTSAVSSEESTPVTAQMKEYNPFLKSPKKKKKKLLPTVEKRVTSLPEVIKTM